MIIRRVVETKEKKYRKYATLTLTLNDTRGFQNMVEETNTQMVGHGGR